MHVKMHEHHRMPNGHELLNEFPILNDSIVVEVKILEKIFCGIGPNSENLEELGEGRVMHGFLQLIKCDGAGSIGVDQFHNLVNVWQVQCLALGLSTRVLTCEIDMVDEDSGK